MSSKFEDMLEELEQIFREDIKFGPHFAVQDEPDLGWIIVWDDATVRPKAKSQSSSYIAFMEDVSDCLEAHGYSLEADADADEVKRNNYLLIVGDDELDWEE